VSAYVQSPFSSSPLENAWQASARQQNQEQTPLLTWMGRNPVVRATTNNTANHHQQDIGKGAGAALLSACCRCRLCFDDRWSNLVEVWWHCRSEEATQCLHAHQHSSTCHRQMSSPACIPKPNLLKQTRSTHAQMQESVMESTAEGA
jgi:hypothetical protein